MWSSKPYNPSGPEETLEFPGIGAKFDKATYLRREAMLEMVRSTSQPKVNVGYHEKLSSPAVWSPDTFSIEDITYRASPEDISELETALRLFKASGRGFNDINRDTFPLPALGKNLRQLSQNLHELAGAVILKGLQPSKYGLSDNIILFAGLASYIGDQRGRQSAYNDVLTHLYSSHDESIRDPRPGLSNHGLPFHNDHCDILALYVVKTALSGGTTRWASFGRIYNEILRTKPHVIDVLSGNDWPHETPTKKTKFLPLLFKEEDGTPFVSFTRFALTGLPTYPRHPSSPQLTPSQADALDTIQYLADKYAVTIEQEEGDILLLNNRAALHARDRIQDPPGSSQRHLMRLCLRDSEYGRPIPEDLKRRWGDIFDADQQKHGRWAVTKEHDPNFISNEQFDSSFTNDETTGSHG
ncbi:hypothetical protein O1611_g749 [Lasiodiplodia mahajangana]|uniref:Uncharacterized protein n=1 Tax=Lasiodiplodia mahajangana TaxID=1108764 RepID=A0ACC2JZK6_9PEZI|nr:hypothetical protein O1611_g749 [Lasiodiplodia mahajangana]